MHAVSFQICDKMKVKKSIALRLKYERIWNNNIGGIREKVHNLLHPMRNSSKQVSNEDASSENDTCLANIIEPDAVTPLRQTLSVNSQDFEDRADIVGIQTMPCSLKKCENETYSRNFDDFQESLDVSNCIDYDKSQASAPITFSTYANCSEGNFLLTNFDSNLEINNQFDLEVDNFHTVKTPIGRTLVSKRAYDFRNYRISDIENKYTVNTQAEVSLANIELDGTESLKSLSSDVGLEHNETENEIYISECSDIDSTVEKYESDNWHRTTKDVDSAVGNKVFVVEFDEHNGFTTEVADAAPRAVNPIAGRSHTTNYYFSGKQFVVPSNVFKNKRSEKVNYDEDTQSFRTDKRGYNLFNHRAIRDFIHQLMVFAMSYKCPLRIYSIRENQRDVVAYARCRYKSHFQRFKIEFEGIHEEYATVFIYLEDDPKCTVPIIHTGKPMMMQLRDKERNTVQSELEHVNPQSYYDEVATKIYLDLAHEGNYQTLRHEATYRKARSEHRMRNRKTITSSDVSDIMQKCRNDYK